MIDWQKDGPCMIAALGECMIERRASGSTDGAPAFSGDTLNTLTYMARLLQGSEAGLFYITALGEDADSAAMLRRWKEEGMDTGLVRRFSDRLPGSYTIAVGRDGERCFHYDRSCSAARGLLDGNHAATLQNALKTFRMLYLSGISVAILPPASREKLLALLQSLHKAGVIIVYDSNYRAGLWVSPREARDWCGRVYRETDVALPGFSDEQALFDDAAPGQTCARLADMGVAEIIVKNSAFPCTIAAEGQVSSRPVKTRKRVVDTTAAGDSFNAGYIAARLSGYGIGASVRAGQALAGAVVQYPGAIIPRELTPGLGDALAA